MYSSRITWLQQGEFLDTNFNFKTWMFNLCFVLFNSILKLLLKYFLIFFLSYFFHNTFIYFLHVWCELDIWELIYFVFVKMQDL